MTFPLHRPRAVLLAIAVAGTAAWPALAAPGHDHTGHTHPAATAGHDHSQHGHSRILKIGTFWEAGVDVTDWRKPAKACPAHPQIVSNKAGSRCPITTALTIDRPTTVPKGAAKRLGLILLPATGHKHPLTDARIQVSWKGGKPAQLQHKDGYYWFDLPASAAGPLTLAVSQGGHTQQATVTP
jgi:hypothetical protein